MPGLPVFKTREQCAHPGPRRGADGGCGATLGEKRTFLAFRFLTEGGGSGILVPFFYVLPSRSCKYVYFKPTIAVSIQMNFRFQCFLLCIYYARC